jgi:YVTN family beta-propeller protein
MRSINNKKKMFSLTLVSAFMILMLVSIAGAAPYAFIANLGNQTVSIIDTANNTVTATVDVGSMPAGVAVSLDGTKVYVANRDKDTVSVIDMGTNSVIATISVGSKPWGIAINPEGTKVYVTNQASNTVSVIDAVNNTVTATVPVGNWPVGVVVNPSGTKVYVVNCDGVSVIDPATNTVTDTLPTESFGIAVNREGTKVYVTNNAGNTLFVIDTEKDNITATVSIEEIPSEIEGKPEGTGVYVARMDAENSTISLIDTETNRVVATVSLGSGTHPSGGSINPEEAKVYVVTWEGSNVTVIDAATNTVIATVNVGFSPSAFWQFIVPLPVQPVFPAANFNSNVTGGCAPLSIQFTDTSENTTEWNWNFGDGSNSTEQNPEHTYSVAGNYTVNLTAANLNGTDSKLATITVLEPDLPVPPVADFSSDITMGNVPLSVQFTDASTGNPTEWCWEFGDGEYSGLQNPIHTYYTAGNYTITLGVSNAEGSGSIVKAGYIQVGEASIIPVADFSVSPISGEAPLKVSFTDNSTGNPYSWYWDFGDGTNDSININPEHIYTVPGTYNASLTASNGNGTASKFATITVLEKTVLPAVNTSINVTSGYAPLSVQIISLLQNATEISWDFGDGDNSFANLILDHLYTIPGTYNFSISATNENGTSSEHVQITVLKPPVLPVADFSADTREGLAPLTVQFTDSLENDTERYWDFGDGSNSTEQNPVHTYSKAGKYTVTLTAKNIIGANTVTKYDYVYVINGLEAPVTAFSASPVTGTVPLNVSFSDSSTGSPTSWKWNFGDGNTSTEQNPVHIYSKAGQYTVSLTTGNAVGSNALTKYSYINAANVLKAPVTAFSALPTSGTAPLNVSFTDNSTESPTSWKWSFGDGKSSSEQNPVHTYTKAGKYNVTLTAKNTAGSNAVTKSGYITVSKKN